MIRIRSGAASALDNPQLQKNMSAVIRTALHSRDNSVAAVANWETLRQYAHDVKEHTLARLDSYLEQLEERVVEQGGKVVWVENGEEALSFITRLAHEKNMTKVVKSKTMLGEEIHLNKGLEAAHIEPVETDLGEYIIQLAKETPFHIIAPALHKSRQEVSDLFTEKVNMPPTDDVQQITATARRILRAHFLTARLGITGVNFGVAETGTLVVVENEGNARLSASVPEVHIALMGIEKVIPRAADLSVFLKLLTRSATGQKITSYVNFINGPRRPEELDGPAEFYLVLIDNGRSKILADSFLRQTLACIRCGACLNVCPVYQRIGGHAYGSTYPGPIGAILTPQLLSEEEAPEHPYASSLCGACYETCPVKIEIPHILLKLRERVQRKKNDKASHIPLEKWSMQIWAWGMSSSRRFAWFARLMRAAQGWFLKEKGSRIELPVLNGWTRHRDLPTIPKKSFREVFKPEEKGT